MNITRAAITRPIFIFMLMIGAVIMGFMCFKSMRIEDIPEVNFGVVLVSTVYAGAGPDEVNTLVTRKVEEAVSGVNGIREVTSQSLEGVSYVMTQFEIGTDMDVALNDLRAKVDAIQSNLPDAVEKPTITKIDSASIPIMYMVIKSDVLSNRDLRDLADDKLKDRFSRISGIAAVTVSGGDVREIQVRVRKDKLLAYGIGINDLQSAISRATLNIPSGRVVTDKSEYSVRVLGEFATVDEVRNMTLLVTDPQNPMAKGKLVRLSDVAEVVDSVAERRIFSRLNGRDSILLVIQKARDGNAIEIAKTALQVIEKIKTDFSHDKLDFVITNNTATHIQESLTDLYSAIGLGIFLVAAIVYLFLHNFRGTLIVALAIPTSIFTSVIGMKMLGFTVNTMTMLAMSLAVGVLVDDAIVVIENIYRHLRMGENPKQAALNGRNEIGLAALAITMADVVVFLPIGFLGGILGQIFRPLGLSYVIAVAVSLFVSFTLTPMLASRWYRTGEDLEHPTGKFALGFEHAFGKLMNLYRRGLEWVLHHRWFVFTIGNLSLVAVVVMIVGSMFKEPEKAFMAGFVPMLVTVVIGALIVVVQMIAKVFGSSNPVRLKIVPYALLFGLIFPVASMFGHMSAIQWKKADLFTFQFFPSSDSGAVEIKVQLPPGASLTETEKVIQKIENIVKKHPDQEYVLSSIGTQSTGLVSSGNQGSNYGAIVVSLKDKASLMDNLAFWRKSNKNLRTKSDTKVVAEMLQSIGRLPEAEVFVSKQSSMGFGSDIQVSFSSDNRTALLETVSKLQRQLKTGVVPGLINPDISSKPGKPELRAIPDRTKLADAGISTAQLANTMRVLYEGNNDTKFRVSGKEYDIRVMMDRRDRDDPLVLSSVPVTFQQGRPVFLDQVAKLQPGTGIDKIDRRNRAEEVKLSADLLPGYAAGTVQNELTRFLESHKEEFASQGITYKPLGQADFMAREGVNLLLALITGLFLVYMLLASLYDNVLYPFIIQLAQPQAMVGAILALLITDNPLNIVGFLGLITLVGLVGKNAILLVDYTNTLRSRGKNRHDALVESGPTRLRPILMTTFALILSMLPIALAIGRGSEFRATIGIAIIGGISLSTLLTLFVIPCSYTIFDDLSQAISRLRNHGQLPPSDGFDEGLEGELALE
jgi:HAE1 family hydrophobic/amphiphilic exporter-1